MIKNIQKVDRKEGIPVKKKGVHDTRQKSEHKRHQHQKAQKTRKYDTDF